jgi:integrase
MARRGRSPNTVASYRDHVERMLRDWLDYPLMTLGQNPRMVADRHDKMTHDHGAYAANNAMRTLRAVYNHARKTARILPADNPTFGVDWNPQHRRDTAMGAHDLPRWFTEAGRLRHPIRREFHLFLLLSGSRPGALMEAKLEHLHVEKRLLHIPTPKGGPKKAFDIPLSRPMIRCLVRAMRASRILHPQEARTWIFAADSGVGHLVEHDEPRSRLFKWGNDLRQSFRTLGQACGLSEIDMHLLMNHSIPGVNAGYITRAKLLSDHLLTAQERLSKFIIDMGRARRRGEPPPERLWPLLPSRKIANPILDPRAPDPRLGKQAMGRPRNRPRKEDLWENEAGWRPKSAVRA